MPGSTISQAGVADKLAIDGVGYRQPKRWDIPLVTRQAAFKAMNDMTTYTAPYDGDGLPTTLDTFSCQLPFDLSEGSEDLTAAMARLRTEGGVHTLAYWRQEEYTYRLRAGQVGFWLPRGDAGAQGFVGFDFPQLAAVVALLSGSVPTPTTVYKTSVSASDSVPDGEVWISKDVRPHPESGKGMAFAKLGHAPTTPTTMRVLFYPLYRVVVSAVPRQPTFPGFENVVLVCAETN